MSSREDENAKPMTVKIIETVYVEADTADDFKSVVQRLTGKDAVAAEAEQSSRPASQGHGSRGDHKAAGASGTRQNG
ncbi:hypothetical protein BAE44_0005095 [Dichanthelium oligosanthes]|uniref:VQ domain-containing protein n=1 Tax=Dichanthelium oligosanthes TaxID=888268 RepID=A0A1E5W973_9POAL|nr:hypothetical protein BAE44_0005095 [Dichanthelium oligosanthes]